MSEPPTPSGSTAEGAPGVVAQPRPGRARALRETLAGLSRLDGVTGGLLVTPDGLVIASELPSRYPAEALAALGATLGRELEVADERLGRGPFTAACFAAEDGTMFVSGSRVGFVMLLGASTVDAPAVLRALGDALARLD